MILIFFLFIPIASATTYDWIMGEPVITNTEYEWIMGEPYVVIEEEAEAPPADTCNPTSPLTANHIFDCNDNCTQDATLNANGYSITWNNAGNYYLEANIENVKNITAAFACNFIIGSGDIIGMYN